MNRFERRLNENDAFYRLMKAGLVAVVCVVVFGLLVYQSQKKEPEEPMPYEEAMRRGYDYDKAIKLAQEYYARRDETRRMNRPIPWNHTVNPSIAKALLANRVRGCPEFSWKEWIAGSNEYVVRCTNGQTTYYRVWPNIQNVAGPIPNPE
jgi:hypothetical protein